MLVQLLCASLKIIITDQAHELLLLMGVDEVLAPQQMFQRLAHLIRLDAC